MGYFEDLGFIPNNAPPIDKIIILSLMRPRLIYGLQLNATQHKIGNKLVKIIDALANLNIELNRLISRVSFKQFKRYASEMHNQQGLSVVNRNFWKKYPQLRKYLDDLNQDEEVEIKHRLEKRLPGRNKVRSPEVRIYMDYEEKIKNCIASLNTGQIPLEFLHDPLQAYLEQAIIQKQGSPELWLNISLENLQRNQIEDAIYAAEEAYWSGNLEDRLAVINYMKEKFSHIEPTTPLLEYYSYALKWYQDPRYGTREEPPADDAISQKYDPYHKLAFMYLAMAPEGYAADPLVKLPPPFRLKSTVLLSVILNNAYEDLVVLARKLEDTLQQVLIWGVKDSDLSPQIRQTIGNYYALQEHDTGVSQSVKQLNLINQTLGRQNFKSSAIIIFDLLRSLLHFNRRDEAIEIFDKLPSPNINEINVTEGSFNQISLEDRHSTKVIYLINYALLKMRLSGDATLINEVLDNLATLITQITGDKIMETTQYRVIFTQTLIILLDHIEQMNIEPYIDKIFTMVQSANVELQFLFAVAPNLDSNLMYRVNKYAIIKNRYLKFAEELLKNHYDGLIALCKAKGLYLYLNILVIVVVATNDGSAKLRDLANILIEQIQNPVIRNFDSRDIIGSISYNSWLAVFRDVKTYNEILEGLIAKANEQRRELASLYLELCLTQLLAEKKHPTASDRYLALGERLWNYTGTASDSDAKEKLLGVYINIAPYFGLTAGSLFLREQFEKWNLVALNPETSSNLVSEVGFAVGSATSKLEKDMSVTLDIINELLTANETILNADLLEDSLDQPVAPDNRTKRKAPFVLFQGLAQILANLSKLALPEQNLVEIYSRVTSLVDKFLNSPYMQKQANAGHISFPIRALFWCSLGFSNLDIGKAEDLLEIIFARIPSLNDSQYKFTISYFLEALQDDSGPLRNEILERITKETIRRVQLAKTQLKSSGLSDYLYEILSLLIRVITNSDSKIVSEFRKLRGEEENSLVTEIYRIMRDKDILY